MSSARYSRRSPLSYYDSGAPYIRAGEYAAKAVASNPEKSNRALADELGVSPNTVLAARKNAGERNRSPEKKDWQRRQKLSRQIRTQASATRTGQKAHSIPGG